MLRSASEQRIFPGGLAVDQGQVATKEPVFTVTETFWLTANERDFETELGCTFHVSPRV
jgi:hypothetical protein